MLNKSVLVTAGPSWVRVDSVRVITNVFTGKTGTLVAEKMHEAGAGVTLLLGPVNSKELDKAINVKRFKYYDELYSLMKDEIKKGSYDIIIHTAAVSDYEATNVFDGKIGSNKENLTINLKPTIKIVDQIKKWAPDIFLIKFKLEVCEDKDSLIDIAYQSMKISNADLIVANNMSCINEERKMYIINKKKEVVETKEIKELSDELIRRLI